MYAALIKKELCVQTSMVVNIFSKLEKKHFCQDLIDNKCRIYLLTRMEVVFESSMRIYFFKFSSFSISTISLLAVIKKCSFPIQTTYIPTVFRVFRNK